MFSQKIVQQTRQRLEEALGFGLREYNLGEVEEFAWRLKDVDWTPGIDAVLRGLPEDIQKYIVNELHLSKIDFLYWVKRYCKILTPERRIETMATLWPSQTKVIDAIAKEEERQLGLSGVDRVKVKIGLLKARQIGGTVISEAMAAHMTFLQPNTQSVIGSDHPDNTLKLWQTLLRIYDNMPGWMRPLPDAKPKAQNLHFPALDSDIVYGSGNQKTTLGQGMTVDYAHISEVSTWVATDYLDEDLMWAFDSSMKHHTIMVMESTGAGGKGNWFHDKFMTAWKGLNDFVPVFIAWYHRPTWALQNTDGVTLTDESKRLAERVKAEEGIDLSKEQLGYWQIKKHAAEAEGKLELFYQEFASTITEAFQTGFKSALPIDVRNSLRSKVRLPVDVYQYLYEAKKLRQIDVMEFIRDPNPNKYEDKLIVWERKRAGHLYIVGVDASHGVEGGDAAAVEVIRVGNRYSPDEQVAEWHGFTDPFTLADIVWLIGHVFCDQRDGYPAMLAVEVQPGSPGISTQTELMRRGYLNFYRWVKPTRVDGKVSIEVGWHTTPFTRSPMIDRGIKYIKEGYLEINSSPLIDELDTFVNTGLEKGKKHLEHAPGYHDDRILALFIALEVTHANDQVNMAAERMKAEEQRKAPSPTQAQFNQILKPWDQLMEEWENSLVDQW